MLNKIDRLGIYRTGGHGDALLLAPALRALRAARPSMNIHLWFRPDSGYVLQHLDLVDSIADYSKGLRRHHGPLDAFVAFEDNGQQGLAAAAARLINGPVAVEACYDRKGTHQADYLFSRISALTSIIGPYDRVTPFELPGDVSACHLSRDYQGYIGIYCGGSSTHKRWPIEQAVRLAHLIRKLGAPVVFIEGPNDTFPIPEQFPVLQLPYLALGWAMSELAAYVGTDTGTTHLAGMLGTPTVALFGPTQPRCWHPVGNRVTVLNCCPRMRNTRRVIWESHDCLHRLTAGEVFPVLVDRLTRDEGDCVFWDGEAVPLEGVS